MESLLQAGLQRAEERAADEGGIVENVERELQAVHGTSAQAIWRLAPSIS
jgi:hypothetical protein